MTMDVRPDGSRYPNHEEQKRALADFTDPGAKTGHGFGYQRALGDLIVDALAGRDIYDGVTESHEDWESFQCVMLQRVALEIRAANHALAAAQLTTDDHPADTLTVEDVCELLRGLARRVDAGAELASRLRDARWGHPAFGGGEARLAEAGAKFHAEEGARARAAARAEEKATRKPAALKRRARS